MDESYLSRREFFRLMGAGALTLYLQGCTDLPSARRSLAGDDFLESFGPFDRTLGEGSTDEFSGDRFERAHAALWDLPKFFAAHPVPAPEASVPVIIVGGGLSGLIAAYSLRAYQPIVLEAGRRFGGNAKAESWRGIDYALGSAYFCQPERGTKLDRLYREIGLNGHYRVKTDEDPVACNGKIESKFWAKHPRLAGYLRDALQERNGQHYPEIPCRGADERKIVDQLDKLNFLKHLTARAGGTLPEDVRVLLEHYSWSSLGGTAEEVSAAAGVNFLAAEFGPVCAAPGGNATVAERVLAKTLQTVPAANFRASSLVVKVTTDGDGARVVYQNADGKLQSLRARAVVMACPKFVVKHVLDGIEPERQGAIESLAYRSYLVANLLLKRPSGREFYDLFLLGDGKHVADARAASAKQGATDVVLANFASSGREAAVLTLYRPLPYDGARPQLLAVEAHATARRDFEAQIEREILPLTGFTARDVAGLRLTRWGHPIPLAKQGIYRSGLVDRLRVPFRERVFFAEQDNWMLPAIETAAQEALSASEAVTRLLGAPTFG